MIQDEGYVDKSNDSRGKQKTKKQVLYEAAMHDN